MLWTLLTDQGRAEDVYLWYRYHYYVLGVPMVEDWEFDELERYCKGMWSIGVWCDVGSSEGESYADYIREGRRPNSVERWERDMAIVDRWFRML